MTRIYKEAEDFANKFQTRNPYTLLDAIGARLKISDEYEQNGLKGYSTILNRTMFAVVNGKLNEYERRVVVGHEAAHLILHKADIMLSPAKAMRDFDLFSSTGRLEHQANQFLADFLISDDELMEVSSDEDSDYFATARSLKIPPPLLAFKLYSMIQRGFNLKNPTDIKSNFLAGGGVW